MKFASRPLELNNAPKVKCYLMDSRWFGPIKRPVEALVRAGVVEAKKPEEFIEYLQTNFREAFNHIQDLSFYRFKVTKPNKGWKDVPHDGFEI